MAIKITFIICLTILLIAAMFAIVLLAFLGKAAEMDHERKMLN